MVKMEDSSPVEVSTPPGGAIACYSGNQMISPPLAAVKKRRNVAGMPDPDAEVIALSPKSLMTTNRFVCEVCNKGFQRDQNLQLHRRGHNLPWKLRQRTGGEVRKRVYVCPEPSCVHHDPSRALGDLTGIKKHFSRKHGEKNWSCERCSKKYAVKSDLKAHSKICGTKEYKCDCGTLFTRRDSFITHRAFCDTINQERSPSTQIVAFATSEGIPNEQTLVSLSSSPPQPPLTPSGDVVSPVPSIQSPEVTEDPAGMPKQQPAAADVATSAGASSASDSYLADNNHPMYSNLFSSPAPVFLSQSSQPQPSSFSDLLCTMAAPSYKSSEFMSLSLSPSLLPLFDSPASLVPSASQEHHHHHHQSPALSATALLQKAAQVGATGSGSSFLRSLGLGTSLENQDNTSSACMNTSDPVWLKQESNSDATFWLGLGSSSLTDMNMGGRPTLYRSKQDALDLGLGISLLTSMGTGLGASAPFGGVDSSEEDSWKGPSETKSSQL